jgi:hypothetical protein
MFRFATLFILSLGAAPAFAQNDTAPAQPAPSGPPPAEMAAIQAAGQAFGQCIQGAVGSVPATVTPEAGATSVLATCATQRAALERAAQALVAAMPEAQRAMAQEQVRTQMASVPDQIAAGIRQMRGSAAPAPAATPAQ